MIHPVDEYVGGRIREERLRAGYSQKILAAGIGIKFQQVQKYETGRNRVSCSKLWEIANTLSISAETLLPKPNSLGGNKASIAEPQRISGSDARFIRRFANLGERERRVITALISSLENK